MKKFTICLMVYIGFLCVPIQAGGSEVSYQIKMDSKSNNTYELKEEVLTIFADLCKGIKKESYAPLLKENIEAFETIKDAKVKWRNNMLVIRIGNGKGTHVEGTFEKENICFEEVKPKSRIQEWLGA